MDKRKAWGAIGLLIIGVIVCACSVMFSDPEPITIESYAVSDASEETDIIPDTEEPADVKTEKQATYPVYVSGEVNQPGIFNIEGTVYLFELISMADGLTDAADADHIDMVYLIDSPQSIYIPAKEEKSPDQRLFYSPSSFSSSGMGRDSSSREEKININQADAAALESLPGIGSKTAGKIISYREEHGGFSCVDDIKNVPGIGENKFAEICNQICV